MIKTVVTFLLLVKVSPPQLALCIRMNLLVGLFLVLINSFNSATAKIPNAEGINALVAYLFICIFFVFCAMLSYAGESSPVPVCCDLQSCQQDLADKRPNLTSTYRIKTPV